MGMVLSYVASAWSHQL